MDKLNYLHAHFAIENNERICRTSKPLCLQGNLREFEMCFYDSEIVLPTFFEEPVNLIPSSNFSKHLSNLELVYFSKCILYSKPTYVKDEN